MTNRLWSTTRLSPLFLIVSVLFLTFSCKQEKTPSIEKETVLENLLPDWTKNSTIYGVNINQFTAEGTINSFSSHIPRLKDMGINVIQLSPFFINTTDANSDELNSIYATVDFNTIDPKIGTKQDLFNLIDKIHAYKMKVIIEWSIDFTSKDHKWVSNFPEYYLNDTILNQDFANALSCSSIGILNLENEAVQDSIMEQLSHWITNHDVNGFAFNSINKNNFLDKAFSILSKTHSDLLLINKDVINDNSDAQIGTFDWKLYSLMNDVANGRKGYKTINDYITSEPTKTNTKVNFITTYVENALNGSEIERLGDAYQAFAVFIHTIDGIPYIHNGQEEPMQKRLSFCDENKIGFNNFGALHFYRDLIKLKKNNKALWNSPSGGKMEFFQDHEHILSFKRIKDTHQVYVIINMSDQEQKIELSESIGNVKDIFKKQNLEYVKGEFIKFEPWEFIVAVKQ